MCFFLLTFFYIDINHFIYESSMLSFLISIISISAVCAYQDKIWTCTILGYFVCVLVPGVWHLGIEDTHCSYDVIRYIMYILFGFFSILHSRRSHKYTSVWCFSKVLISWNISSRVLILCYLLGCMSVKLTLGKVFKYPTGYKISFSCVFLTSELSIFYLLKGSSIL